MCVECGAVDHLCTVVNGTFSKVMNYVEQKDSMSHCKGEWENEGECVEHEN